MNGGHEWTRTIDHHHVKVVLYQLSYATTYFVDGNYIQTKLKKGLKNPLYDTKKIPTAFGRPTGSLCRALQDAVVPPVCPL